MKLTSTYFEDRLPAQQMMDHLTGIIMDTAIPIEEVLAEVEFQLPVLRMIYEKVFDAHDYKHSIGDPLRVQATRKLFGQTLIATAAIGM